MNNESTVFRSLAIIEEKIHERLTVESLAESLHFSKYHYQRIFREAVGDSVMRYVAKRRIAHAAAELAQTDHTVLEIALRYGYDSHEGFTRGFRAYMGVTPTEYRKYHSYIGLPKTKTQKERCAVMYSKATDEIIRELNSLIVQAKETAEYIRANGESDSETPIPYSKLWDYIADKTDAMADKLTEAMERVTAIEQRPDEITAMLMIIKTVEYAVFQSDTVAFQAGLMMSRANPEERELFKPVSGKLKAMSHSARIKSSNISVFFNELAALIFEDIRADAQRKIQQAKEAGNAAYDLLKESSGLSCEYIKEGVSDITRELSFTPLENITAEWLEDYSSRLEIIGFSADLDAICTPDRKKLFDGLSAFKEQISGAAEFFGSLYDDVIQAFDEPKRLKTNSAKKYGARAFRENTLLFYLKGETEKLEPYLNEERKTAFNGVIDKLKTVIRLVNYSYMAHEETVSIIDKEIDKMMIEAYETVKLEAEELGEHGASLEYIAEELRLCGICRRVINGG